MAASWEITNNSIQWVDRLIGGFSSRILLAARAVRDRHKENLSVQWPPASLPGEFPRMRTGTLADSVIVLPDNAREISQLRYCEVKYDVQGFYGNILSSQRFGRFGIGRTYYEMRSEIMTIINAGWRDIGKT